MYEWLLYDYYVREKEDDNVINLISNLLHFDKDTQTTLLKGKKF